MGNNHAGEAGYSGFPVSDVLEVSEAWDDWQTAKPASRSLAIIGSHPKGLEGVPWDDPDVEIWVFNEAPLKSEKYPRWDACLQIHLPEVYSSPNNWINPDYWPWLQQPHGKKIYMQDVDPRVPDSVKYPLEEILAMIPFRYLRSSPAAALALGIYMGYKHILLFGSELTSNTEYAYQANNYAFWIGFAIGRGVNLELRCWNTEFYEQPIYGFEGELQIEAAYFGERIAECEKAWKTNQAAYDKIKARVDAAMLKNDYERVAKLSLEAENIAQVVGETYGTLAEARRYSEREDLISRQEFERVAAQAQIDGDNLRSEKDHAGGKTEYVWNVWRQTGQIAALNQVRTFLAEKLKFAYETGVRLGVYRENLHYMSEYDKRLQAAGGVRALGKAPEKG